MEDLKDYKVCIETSFYIRDSAYSLINCVEDQIRMFVDNGYKIKVIVEENFPEPSGPWAHPNVKLERIPPFNRSNDGVLPINYEEQVEKLYNRFKEILQDVKVVLTHDLILMPAELIPNMACRKLASERNDLRWLHWSHSSTAMEVRCSDPSARNFIKQKFPNSFICYPNSGDCKRVAMNLNVELDEVKTVHHPSDICSLLFGDEVDTSLIPNLSDEARQWLIRKVNYPIKLSKDFIKEFSLFDADVISVYPCRLDRGKQPEWNIKTMAKIKQAGRSVKMIVVDFHSTFGDKSVYREELKKIGKDWGLEINKDLIFTSEWKENTHLHVPREFVMNLRKLSDFHMHPSTSETYSLVVQEAMLTRNFCVLNHHTNYMKSIYGEGNVLYEPMGAAYNMLDGEDGATNIKISDEQKHFDNLAKKVLYFIEKANPILAQFRFMRKTRNTNYVFLNELEPLLYYQSLNN